MTLCNNLVISPPFLGEIATAAPKQTEAQRWADILFNPDDILEIRFIPPKAMIHDRLYGQFLWGRTKRRAGFKPWIQARRLDSLTNELAQFTADAAF